MATEQQEHLKIQQLREQAADEIEVIAGREKENLEGWIPSLATDAEVREALEKAFDYRGDVTITRKDGSTLEGYLFDRRSGTSLSDSFVRVIPLKERTKVNVSYGDIAALAFSGRDTAAGKTFDAWVKKYWEKKAAGEKNIQIEPEKLD
jgi:3D (Asp-Asp-Asp) domain-containing protein